MLFTQDFTIICTAGVMSNSSRFKCWNWDENEHKRRFDYWIWMNIFHNYYIQGVKFGYKDSMAAWMLSCFKWTFVHDFVLVIYRLRVLSVFSFFLFVVTCFTFSHQLFKHVLSQAHSVGGPGTVCVMMPETFWVQIGVVQKLFFSITLSYFHTFNLYSFVSFASAIEK